MLNINFSYNNLVNEIIISQKLHYLMKILNFDNYKFGFFILILKLRIYNYFYSQII